MVWNARAGQDKDDVAGWVRRIFQRARDTARVMVIATHSDEAAPDLDYATLQRKYPDMMAGQYAVDNKSGRGIAELGAALTREAAAQRAARARHLPVRAQSWLDARDQVLARAEAEPYISFGEFAAACAQHGMTEDDAAELAELLNDRGLITYLGDDGVLAELVVLNPEWLSKAIGHVMEDEDGAIRVARGVLDHQRLGQIWRDRPGEPAYSRRLYPYFLRVMEKFEASFRLEDGAHSLIAQLVPGGRPDGLPWRRDTPLRPGLHRLVLLCTLSGAMPGFMSRLTVRLGYADTGLRWRGGVFLRHPVPAYASEALMEMVTDTRVRIEVRAPSPDFFLRVLRDGVERLAASSPGLTYRMLTPCPAETTAGCGGVFRLKFLLAQPPAAEVPCQECGHRYQVAELLAGLRQADSGTRRNFGCGAARGAGPRRRLAAARHRRPQAGRACRRGGERGRDAPPAHRGERRGPRLPPAVYPGADAWQGHRQAGPAAAALPAHAVVRGTRPLAPAHGRRYPVERTAEWFREVARYVRPVLQILRAVVPVAGPVADLVFTKDQADQAGT